MYDLSVDRANGDLVVVGCVKVLLLTFMRVGAIVPSKWDEINWDDRMWIIPNSRMKGRDSTGQDHLIPMSEALIDVMRTLQSITGNKEYIFDSPRGKAIQHISLEHLIT